MSLSVNLEATEEFRQHIRNMISGQVRSILREELKGIVHGEMAKLRLMKPDSQVLGDLVLKEVNDKIKSEVAHAVRCARTNMYDEIAKLMREQMQPLMTQVRADIKTQLIRAIRETQ